MQDQKVSIVHIFDYLTTKSNIVNLLENNSCFLTQHNVEYIVVDNLQNPQEDLLLKDISKVPSYQVKKFEYAKEKSGNNLKDIFQTSVHLANNQNIFFIFNEIEININNVFDIEKTAPFLQKQDVEFFRQNIPENFHPKNFKLYMKKNKNILDKLKLIFI